MIFRRTLIVFCIVVFSFGLAGDAKAELFSGRPDASRTNELLAGLAFFEKFTDVDLSDGLRAKYNAVVVALNRAASFDAGSDEAQEALTRADTAYSDFLSAYGNQLKKLKDISDGSFDEIFDAIDWSADEYAACVGYRDELLTLLNAAVNGVTAAQIKNGTLNIELAECEARLNAASIKLDRLILGWEAEIEQKKQRVAELKEQHAAAVAAGDTKAAEDIQNEIDNLENEEIPELERKVEKSKKIKKSFSLEKLLQGLGKIALGIITIIFSSECGEDAADGCENLGVGLIANGGKDVGDAFDPPDETVTYQETEVTPAERDTAAVEKEKAITEAVTSDPKPLCCEPSDIKPEMTIVQTTENGPLSFGYEVKEGKVSTIYLIQNSDGTILAEIKDALLFFAKGGDLPDVTTTAFSSLDRAATQKTDEGTHLVRFDGTLAAGGKASLGVAVSPLTFSGRFKVTFRPAK